MRGWGGHVMLGAVGASLLLNLLLGNFIAESVNDTETYINVPFGADMYARPRTPFYGWFAMLLGGRDLTFLVSPAVHFAAMVAATLLIFRAARDYGLSKAAAMALSIPLLFSNTLVLRMNDIHPEVLSVSLILLGLAFLLWSCRGGARWVPSAVAAALCVGAAYLLKPAFMVFIVAVPVLGLLLMRLRKVDWRPALMRMGALGLLILVPFLSYSTVRHAAVGNFNIVSFAGVASGGMAAQILRPETLDRLPEKHKPIAAFVLAQREQLAADAKILPIPLNSQQQRSYASTALGYFDILARNYDGILGTVEAGWWRGQWGDRTVDARPGSEWLLLNAHLGSFTVAVVIAEPLRYVLWIVGATTRFIGLITVANLPFAAAFLALCGLLVAGAARGRLAMPARPSMQSVEQMRLDLGAIVLIVGLYIVVNYLPAVMLTFPARRYVDTAGVFMAALPLYGIVRLWPLVFGGGAGATRDATAT